MKAEGTEVRNKNFFRQFLSFFYGNFVVLLLGFIQTPLVTRIMSASEYGRTGLFESAVSIIYIFAILGLDQSFIRHYYGKNVDVYALFKSCLFTSLGIVSAILALYILFSERVNLFLFERTGFDITALVVLYTLVSVCERFLILDVRMRQNGTLYSNINIAEKVLNIAIIFIFWRILGDDFRVVLYAMAFSWGSTTLYLGARYLRERREITPNRTLTKVPLTTLIGYGLPFVLVLLMEWLLSSMDRLSLKIWSSYEELGIYTAAMKIMVILLTFKNTFIAFYSPVALERYEKDTIENCKAFFRKAYDLTRLFCVFGAVALILFRKLIVLILGESYRGAETMIPSLTLMPVFAILFEITNQGLKIAKKNIYLNVASAAAIVFNLIGNRCLIPVLGGVGAAITTGVSYIVYFFIGSFFSERFFPVGYSWKRTSLLAIALMSYSLIAGPGAGARYGEIFSYIVGIAIMVLSLVLERDSLTIIIGYLRGLSRRLFRE